MEDGDCLGSHHFLMTKHKENMVAKAAKITITVGITFQDFDFVVAAFGETIGVLANKRIKDACKPRVHCV